MRPNVLEISGPPSCGKLGLALLWLAAASQGGTIAVVDLAGTFYPPAAAACGLDLSRLVVVRPPDRRGAGEAISLLVGSAGFDAVLWPLTWQSRPSGLDAARLSTLASRSQTTLLGLVTDGRRSVAGGEDGGRLFPSADARLRVSAWEWLWRDGELVGVHPRVRAERLRGAMAGQEWQLHLEWHGPEAARERDAGLFDTGVAHAGAAHGGCAASGHLCLAATVPLGSGATRAPGPAGEDDRGVRPDAAPATAARSA
jgi:hypothetical protein